MSDLHLTRMPQELGGYPYVVAEFPTNDVRFATIFYAVLMHPLPDPTFGFEHKEVRIYRCCKGDYGTGRDLSLSEKVARGFMESRFPPAVAHDIAQAIEMLLRTRE